MKKENDYIGIIVGIIIGVVFGFFVQDKINIVSTQDISSEEKVYLLQVGEYDNSEDVLTIQSQLQANGIPNVVVYKDDSFFIYSGISLNDEFETVTVLLDYAGINYVVKSEFIYNYISDYSENELKFWEEGLNYYMKSLNREKIILTEEFASLKNLNIEFYSNIVYLMSVEDDDLLERIRLQTYKLFVENRR
ncbi:hypothetical protein RJG79_06200 [Mycoplasmatota bacterium WC44]